MRLPAFLAAVGLVLLLSGGASARIGGEDIEPSAPDSEIAAALFGVDEPVQVVREEGGVPGWTVSAKGRKLGYIGSTWEIARSVGYSAQPLDILVAVGMDARIRGARLMRHSEPVLILGISTADIERFVNGFAGVDLAAPRQNILKPAKDMPDVISRATISTGTIRDSILRTGRTLAIGRGLIQRAAAIDRVSYDPATWPELIAMGALANTRMTMSQARRELSGAKVPVPEGDAPFLNLYAGLIDPPTVGLNLLGPLMFSKAIGALGPRDAALILISSGLYSPRGTDWRRTGVFDRISIVQGESRFQPRKPDFLTVRQLAIEGGPETKEISVFRLPSDKIDPVQPFRVEVRASRPTPTGEVSTTIALDYKLPNALRAATQADHTPLWRKVWEQKRAAAIFVASMLFVLGLILFFQESFVRRPKLWRRGRIAFLAVTLIVLGWGLNGQLSVVQVVAFVHSLLNEFRWETFLIDPVIFMLWSFVALGLLFWGRGVYCGWLCPFGALQELVNVGAQKLGITQIAVPQALHERLWVIKYSLFVVILALSFYSMSMALKLAEVEPFKTAISMRMLREWPFVMFVLAILVAGLFIERFYCRYLCPLGAGLAIPAKLKIFDWLKRRPQCGRECRLCETKCTVGAIDPLGRINPNECILCLRCQMIYYDPQTCTILKRRASRGGAANAEISPGANP